MDTDSLIVDLSENFPFFSGGRKIYKVDPWDMENNPSLMFWAQAHKDPIALIKNIVEGPEDPKLKQEVEYLLKMDLKTNSIFNIGLRHVAISRYGFAVPDRHALELIKKYSPNGVVEIGAGCGYWANLLAKIGVPVSAYDSRDGKYRNQFKFGAHNEVEIAPHDKALADGAHQEKTLLLCWPDYESSWSAESLSLYKGDTVAYVGEGSGGCTGSDQFHSILAKKWEEAAEYRIPVWWGIHDSLCIFKRKKRGKRNEEKARDHSVRDEQGTLSPGRGSEPEGIRDAGS